MALIDRNDPNHFQDNLPVSPEAMAQETALVGATHVLGQRRQQAKTERGGHISLLLRAEAQARLSLAAAIITLDEIDARVEAGEKIHSMQEQANVEIAQRQYTQALANLIRGEAA